MSTIDGYLREPLRPFHDLRKEDYCRARARGLNNTKASEEAGVDRNTGHVWAKREEIMQRIREIRQSTEGYTEISAAYVLEELKVTVLEARGAGDYKAAIDGLKALHSIISKDKTGMRAAALGVSAQLVSRNETSVRKSLRDELSRPDLPLPVIETTGESDDESA